MDSIHSGVNHWAIQCYYCIVLLKFFLYKLLQCCFWAPSCATLKFFTKISHVIWTMQTFQWTLSLKSYLIPKDGLLFISQQISSSLSSNTILIVALLWKFCYEISLTYFSIRLKGINDIMSDWKFLFYTEENMVRIKRDSGQNIGECISLQTNEKTIQNLQGNLKSSTWAIWIIIFVLKQILNGVTRACFSFILTS